MFQRWIGPWTWNMMSAHLASPQHACAWSFGSGRNFRRHDAWTDCHGKAGSVRCQSRGITNAGLVADGR